MTVAKDVLADVAEAVRANGWARLPGAVHRAAIDQLRAGISALVQGVAPDGRCLYFYESLSGDRRVTRVERVWEAIPAWRVGIWAGCWSRQQRRAWAGRYACSRTRSTCDGRLPPGTRRTRILLPDGGVRSDVRVAGRIPRRLGFRIGWIRGRDGKASEGRFENARGEMSLPMFEGMSPQPVSCGAGDVLLLDGGAPHRTSPNTTQACITHLIVSFNARSAGDHRSSYYAAKVRDFASGRISPNQFVFRVFEFGPKAKPGG